MAHFTHVSRCFSKTFLFVLFISSVASLSINSNRTLASSTSFLNPLTNPCKGRGTGKVRAIDVNSVIHDCSLYVECANDQVVAENKCEYERLYFNAETEECVESSDVCFRCPPNTIYELVSVPHICSQFIHCFNNIAVLGACPGDLVYDGRPGIHQCNRAERPGECYRENRDDYEYRPCPPITSVPRLENAGDNQAA